MPRVRTRSQKWKITAVVFLSCTGDSLIRAQNSRAPLLLPRAAFLLSLYKLLCENVDEDASTMRKREPPLASSNKLTGNGRNQHITLAGDVNETAKSELCVSHRCRKRDHHYYYHDTSTKEEERSSMPPTTSSKQQHHQSPLLQWTHRKTPPLRCRQPRSHRSYSST